jgi:diguanylate cyclase
LLPGRFIPTAERSGLIHPLGSWILDEACKLAAAGTIGRMAVNVSPPQVSRPGFAAETLATIDRHGIDPGNIVLEVTETAFLEMNENQLMALSELTAAGVCIALDDFGTGYSSLNHLRHIPAQIVKIDRSYIADLCVDTETAAIVEAMVGLTRRLGKELVAEGIETEEQAELLRSMGVVLGQGYLLGRAEPVEHYRHGFRDDPVRFGGNEAEGSAQRA